MSATNSDSIEAWENDGAVGSSGSSGKEVYVSLKVLIVLLMLLLWVRGVIIASVCGGGGGGGGG